MGIAKKLISVAMVFVMLAGLLVTVSAASAQLLPDVLQTVSSGKGSFIFIPEQSGWYTFYSQDGEDADPYARIMDGDYEEIAFADDHDGDYNFRVALELTAGKTYYLEVYAYMADASDSTFRVGVTASKLPTGIRIKDPFDIVGAEGTAAYIETQLEPMDCDQIPVSWSSSDETVATFDSNGWVQYLSEGTAMLTVTTANGLSATCEVEVVSYTDIAQGQTLAVDVSQKRTYYRFCPTADGWYGFRTFGAEDVYNDYHATLLDSDMDWVEYDYVSEVGGHIEIFWEMNAGEIYYLSITNYSDDQPPYSLYVDAAATAQELVLKNQELSGYPGNSVIFDFSFQPLLSLPERVSWSSSDETVLAVEQWGWEYGIMKRPGTVTVTATSENGLTAQCTVTVLEPPSISCGEQATMDLAADIPLMFIPQEDGYYAVSSPDAPDGTWGYVRNDAYEELADTESGETFYMAPYLEAGQRYYIEAHIRDNEAVACTIQVEKVSAPTAIIPVPEKRTEYVGNSGILEACFYPANSGEEHYTWSTEDTDIIDLWPGGSYDVLALGTATVTVTSDSGLTATTIIEVVEPPADAVSYGECGPNLLWYKTADGTLTVTGTGMMWGESFCGDDITSVILPQGLTWIGRDAFLSCDNLTQITIPQTVTRLDPGVFYGCDNLRNIYFEGDAPELGEDAFWNVTATAAYLSNSRGWNADVCQSYGGSITWETWQTEGGTISCSVTASDDLAGDVTVALLQDGEVVYTGTDRLYNLTPGSYTMTVSKYGHVTREYAITVGSEAMTQDVEICPIGDVTGDGKVNVGDVGRVYAHIKGSTQITDDYALECANANGGRLNIGDVATIYAHVKGGKRLF